MGSSYFIDCLEHLLDILRSFLMYFWESLSGKTILEMFIGYLKLTNTIVIYGPLNSSTLNETYYHVSATVYP